MKGNVSLVVVHKHGSIGTTAAIGNNYLSIFLYLAFLVDSH